MKNNFLYLPDQTVSFTAFEEGVKKVKVLFIPHTRVLIKSQNLLVFYASIIAARDLKLSLYLCPATFDDDKARQLAAKHSCALYFGNEALEVASMEAEASAPTLGIFTSATTGEPKIALHRWEAIEASSFFVPKHLREQTWLLSYSPWGYAGIQLFFAAFNSAGSICCRKERFEDICQDVVSHSVTVISATPTFWKMLIAAWPTALEVPTLLQATLGGEIVDQSVLSLIDAFFHPQNLTHIYASTEAGTCVVVSDRLAGFPVSFLDKQSKNGARLRVADEELQVLSPISMQSYVEGALPKVDGWVKTGDLVQIKDERVYFLGRSDGRINIGGQKVCPEEVELALNALEEIEDCLVYEKKSPIVGSLIAADVVMKEECTPALLKQKLKGRLQEYKIPHIIRRVDHFEISSAGKKIRKPS